MHDSLYLRNKAAELRRDIDAKTGDAALIIQGRDENENEAIVICPLGHFAAKIIIEKKTNAKPPIGFKLSD